MTAADWIKTHLAGTSAQQPGTHSAMLKASGLEQDTLDDALEQLYNQGIVNRAHILRGGEYEVYYWLTGATPKTVPWKIRLPGSSTTARRAPQRIETAIEKEQAMPQNPPAAGKSRARLMLEYLAEHGHGTGRDLCAATGYAAEAVTSYLGGHIKRGLIVKERHGNNSKDGCTYRVAPGVSAEDLLADARSKNVPPHKRAARPAPAQESAPAAPPASNVREFKRQDVPDTVKPVYGTEKQEPDRQYHAHQVSVDATGQMVIQQPGVVRMVFPPDDTRRIQKLLLAIDLESLCA